MAKLLEVVLLLALPASGKSEVRTYMDGLTPKQCRDDMHMGPTLQLDDYPYVHFMHRIDDELYQRGFPYVFYLAPDRPMIEDYEWGIFINLLNEDFDNLKKGNVLKPVSAAQLLFDRIDNARAKVGLERVLEEIPYGARMEIADAMEKECQEHLDELNGVFSQSMKGKTVVIEAARGGPNGSDFPLTPPNGYQYSFSVFSEDILNKASILYVWVDPEESRRKNTERARPDGQSSILHHGVPMEVMLAQYACDDMDYLISQSDKENTVKVERAVVAKKKGKEVYVNKVWNLPVGRFDNRKDLTTFIRKKKKDWTKKEIDAIHSGLGGAMKTLAKLS